MGKQGADFQRLNTQVGACAERFVTALNRRDGCESPGPLLSADYIKVLDRYAAYVQQLPDDQLTTTAWLGYVSIFESELSPRGMLELFTVLKTHAAGWAPLKSRCQELTLELEWAAIDIERTGKQVLVEGDLALKLLERRGIATTTAGNQPVDLAGEELKLVASMAAKLQGLRSELHGLNEKINSVHRAFASLRDDALTNLMPAVNNKIRALRRYRKEPPSRDVDWELTRLDAELGGLRREYLDCSSDSTARWGDHPPAKQIAQSINARRAKEIRTEYHSIYDRWIALSSLLKMLFKAEGQIQTLGAELGQLELELRDMATGSSHLHSLWQMLEIYAVSAHEKLSETTDSQGLMEFEYYFDQFLKQWATIGQSVVRVC